MRAQEPSRTSMLSAIARGMHRELHAAPWVLDDPYALPLVGPSWPDIYAGLTRAFSEPVRHEAIAAMLARSRHAEERVLAGEFTQYVLLGAGLDSFAWRRPDRLDPLRVFEVDHPATQVWKQQRSAVLALPQSEQHVFAPVDFESQRLREGLDAAGFKRGVPALFSWLGVVPYLTLDAIETTLRDVAGCAPGSEIVLSFVPPEEFLDDRGREFFGVMTGLAAAAGEPLQSVQSPHEMQAIVTECGLQTVEHLDAQQLRERYFADRDDGLRPYTVEHLLVAAVPA